MAWTVATRSSSGRRSSYRGSGVPLELSASAHRARYARPGRRPGVGDRGPRPGPPRQRSLLVAPEVPGQVVDRSRPRCHPSSPFAARRERLGPRDRIVEVESCWRRRARGALAPARGARARAVPTVSTNAALSSLSWVQDRRLTLSEPTQRPLVVDHADLGVDVDRRARPVLEAVDGDPVAAGLAGAGAGSARGRAPGDRRLSAPSWSGCAGMTITMRSSGARCERRREAPRRPRPTTGTGPRRRPADEPAPAPSRTPGRRCAHRRRANG